MWLVASAVAAELLVWVPAGIVEPGARSTIGVWCEGCTAPLAPADVEVSGAPLLGSETRTDGTLLVEIGPPEGKELRLTALTTDGILAAVVPVQRGRSPAVDLTVPADAALADGTVELFLRAAGATHSGDVVVYTSEGTVGPVRSVAEGYAATITLGGERVARPLLVAASLRSQPAAPPAFGATRLRARITGNVAAEAGSRITIRLGGRGYGPFSSGSDGTATVTFDAFPGESTYELSVSDDLGNTQKLSQAVPASQRPVLLGAAVATARGGELWLAATDARGAAWSGVPPTCRSGTGAADPPAPLDRGRWRWTPASGGPVGMTVGCSLAETTLTVRLPPRPPVPAALTIRVYPEVLSADFPLAEVQAALVDASGERLPIDGVQLSVAHGALVTSVVNGVVRGEYDGTGAAALGGDHLQARWSPATGIGPPAELRLCIGLGQAGPVAVARALDASGHPLPGLEIRAQVGAEALLPTNTDARGFARWLLPSAGAQRVRVEAGSAVAEAPAFGSRPDGTDCIAASAADRSDLEAQVEIAIRSGRVRQVILDTEPRTLTLGAGATARIRVRMLDAAGGLVRDEPLTITASEGAVGLPTVQADGALVADFSPATQAGAREVQISATTQAGTVSTTLSVAPRPVRGLVWAGVGWTTNFAVVASPWGSFGVEHKLPLEGLSLRAGLGLYGLDERVMSGGESVHAEGTFLPIEVGATLTDRGPRFSLGAGLGIVLVPYSLSAVYADGEQVGGFGLSPPGVDAHGAAGWRIGQTELFVEAAYLLYLAPEGAITLAGNAGGLRVLAGYRLLY